MIPAAYSTILLVDDDPAMLAAQGGSLREAGYEVLEAHSFSEALLCAAGAVDRFASLVVSYEIADSPAGSLLQAVRSLWPALPVVVINPPQAEASRPANGHSSIAFLSKPFAPGALVAAVEGLLRQTGRGRVLTVDDDPIVRDFVNDVLESGGYVVESAGNGEEAMAHLRKSVFDVIFTDVYMPGTDGLELLSYLRRQNSHAKIVAVSGAMDNTLLGVAHHMGAHSVLCKPFTPDQLLETVNGLLD